MEELRSTEVLDREILEDARKKAFRILKTADETVEAQERSWEKKIVKAVDSIREAYAEKIRKTREEILARLPLDKRRLRTETSEAYLVKAMDDFLRALPREKLSSVLERELRSCLEACAANGEKIAAGGTKPELLFSGLGLSEARGTLERVLAAVNKKLDNPFPGRIDDWVMKEDPRHHEFPSVVINSPFLKITASVESSVKELLKVRRAELAAALLGEGVLND